MHARKLTYIIVLCRDAIAWLLDSVDDVQTHSDALDYCNAMLSLGHVQSSKVTTSRAA